MVNTIAIKLNNYDGHVLEQIRRQTCELPSGTHVRVFTGWAMVPIWGIIIPSYLDEGWHRADLNWIWEHSDPRQRDKWNQYLLNFKGAK
jgi:hypothetical protein